MGKVVETVQTINSAVRTFIAVVILGGAGIGGYAFYSKYSERDRELRETSKALTSAKLELDSAKTELASKIEQVKNLEIDVAEKQERINRLETALHLLKVDQRLARLEVVRQEKNEESGHITTTVRFVELSPNGDAISEPREFQLHGDVVYVDNWIVKFDDKFIEEADLERGTSLCLFRRIFGENQSPIDGFSLDEVGMRPQAYARGSVMSDFEKEIWKDFWEFANDPRRAAEMGIRAANGEAVSVKVREGMKYSLELRTSGGMSISPIIDEAETPKQ
jgi:uncharacterized protein YneR